MAGWPPSPRVYGLGGGGSGPEKRREAPRRDTRPNAGFLSLFNLLLLVDALYACYCFVVAFICLHLLARRLRGAPACLGVRVLEPFCNALSLTCCISVLRYTNWPAALNAAATIDLGSLSHPAQKNPCRVLVGQKSPHDVQVRKACRERKAHIGMQ